MRDGSARIVAWNIRQGGGPARMPGIALALLAHEPDLCVLCEVRRTTGGQIAGVLADHGLPHRAWTDPAPGSNGILIASRVPLAVRRADGAGPDPSRCLEAEAGELGLRVVAVHAPVRTAGTTERAAFFSSLVERARSISHESAAIVGDLNAGRGVTDRPDRRGSGAEHLGRLASLGFVDAWRALHPGLVEGTWESRAGRHFRLDQAWISRALAPRLVSARHDQSARLEGVSDHAILSVTLKST